MRVVETAKGAICGIEKEGYSVFKGIPYAKPPVGKLRFCPPQEMEPWDGVWEALQFPNRFCQPDHDDMFLKEFYSDKDYLPQKSEDALYLNIWTPAKRADEKLPVAFWIHGGAFLMGFGSEMEFDGAYFAKNGVILVTCNYRLGAFGFLAHPWLADACGHAGNYGIMDQIAALEWVYENIGAFGGDSEKITVFGQSAGAMSVQTLVSSPLSKNMIHQAIMQSGGGYKNGLTNTPSLQEAYQVGERLVTLCGVSDLEELQNLPAKVIEEKTMLLHREAEKAHKPVPFQPCVDHYVLMDTHDRLLENGKIKRIPYMLGTTSNDLFATEASRKNHMQTVLEQGCIGWSYQLEKLGWDPAYVYYFTKEPLGDDAGAYHSVELWYLFGTLDRSWRPKEDADYALSKRMIAYWTNFIKSGNVNGDGLEVWLPCTRENCFIKELC